MSEEGFQKTKLSSLDKRIKSFAQGYRQNIALLGDDPEEIPYILDRYLHTNKLQDIIYVRNNAFYVDKKDFLKSVILSLLSEYTDRVDALDNLINATQSTLINTTDFIKSVLKKDKLSFLDVLEVINKFINESDRSVIFVIEEFLKLKEIFPHVYQAFSKFIILQKKCMVVLTSSQPKEAEKVLAGDLNLLFGNFEKMYFNENIFLDNYIYLKQLLEPLDPSPFFISFFIDIIGSNIVYYDLMAKKIRQNYYKDREEESIISILKDTLYSKETYFFQKFIRKVDLITKSFKDGSCAIKILFSIKDGYIRKKDLISLDICSYKETKSKLQKLCDLNYIENLGNVYKIKDSLFSFWLAFIFKLYFFSSFCDPEKRKYFWQQKIQQELDNFKENFFKDKVKKILELLSSFKDDTLHSGKNKYNLPLIDKLKMISYPEKSFHLIVGEGKKVVFAGVKEKRAEESDIFDFIEKGERLKGDRVKKIFISLEQLSPTAKLVAKNHRIIAWDVNEINQLLRIYNKPTIFCNLEQSHNKVATKE